jgi:hypothetical protein
MGERCFIQFHVDLDPGPGIRDYACGSLTYDGHNGTDIRVPDLPTMIAGVAVVAAADGIVRAIREGEPDQSIDDRGLEALQGKDAGNAVVIDHGDGWETQYSHMKRGSIRVQKGQAIKAGMVLGEIGLSGRSNFPHLDFSVRHNEKVIDPFRGERADASCGDLSHSLWTPVALAKLPYRPSGVLLAGFADHTPEKNTVRAGGARQDRLAADAQTLALWADVYGLHAGDVEEFRVLGPDGALLFEQRATVESNAHQRFNFVGKRRAERPWPSGRYLGEYRLLRTIDGKETLAASARREAVIGNPD